MPPSAASRCCILRLASVYLLLYVRCDSSAVLVRHSLLHYLGSLLLRRLNHPRPVRLWTQERRAADLLTLVAINRSWELPCVCDRIVDWVWARVRRFSYRIHRRFLLDYVCDYQMTSWHRRVGRLRRLRRVWESDRTTGLDRWVHEQVLLLLEPFLVIFGCAFSSYFVHQSHFCGTQWIECNHRLSRNLSLSQLFRDHFLG